MTTFKSKTAIIFGAGQNIGRAIGREFAKRGARVAITDINASGADEAAQTIRDGGGDAISLVCDVTKSESVAAAAREVEHRFGPVDIVVNNAGLLHNGWFEDIPLEEWQRMFDVNLYGMIRSLEVFVPQMLARGAGHIVNTASFAGLYPFAINRIPYAASKAAVVSMSQNLALHLESKGVRVSCLCPGPVMTTSADTMKTFSGEMEMRGPGSHLRVKSQAETARILANGMEAGLILIPTHEELWETLKHWANGPDAFVREKAAAFGSGDIGKPSFDPSALSD